jgi:AraC-like DNA-binding protein
MRKSTKPAGNIALVRYEAPAGYRLDLEILSMAEFRRRVSTEHLRQPQRIGFHALLYVTAGRCTHAVDFETHSCRPGTLLLLSPGQVQQFDGRSVTWSGWLVIFRPELFPARSLATDHGEQDVVEALAELPVSRTLGGADHEAVAEALARMAADSQRHEGAKRLQGLLRHQLLALLTRLQVCASAGADRSAIAPAVWRRFQRYRVAVEQHFSRLHQVNAYARLIGCSPKSLQRAVTSATGQGAKDYLSQRIALEAKRLLSHTDLSVSQISDTLGFDEVTNFVKFFRRESGSVPQQFRRQYSSRSH